MAKKSDNLQLNIKNRINTIKNISNDPISINKIPFDVSESNGFVKKQITNITTKLKGKTDNKKDIFEEIINTVEGFIGNDVETPKARNGFPAQKNKILDYTKRSVSKSIHMSKEIILDEVKNVFFSNDGICGGRTTINGSTTFRISPSEFDFLNLLQTNPNSTTGKIMYENTNSAGNKFNRVLYELFNSGTSYNFKTNGGDTLFNIVWVEHGQYYEVTTNSNVLLIGDFLNEYYSTIEYPDLDYILKTSILMTIQGEPTESDLINDGFNYLDRLLKKLFSLCGTSTPPDRLKNNTTLFEEDEIDIEKYFDFDDVEGIDIDDEDARKRKVLKFKNCDVFEIPINPIHIENFVYSYKNLDDNIDTTLLNTANEVSTDSDNNMYLLSLINSFILKLPKALISSILSPKMLFPIIAVYKIMTNQLTNGTNTVLVFMKLLSNLFFTIIKTIYWKFVSAFWLLIKKDLLLFISKLASKILKNKIKRYKTIVLSLIALLTKLLDLIEMTSCDDIFNTISQTIESALNVSGKIPVPGVLLSLSDNLPGFSSDRAYMTIIEKLNVAGVNTGPIYGTDNKLPLIIKSILDGHTEEMDSNSYIKTSNKEINLTQYGAPVIIPPGILQSVGKML